jgi:hypothetical protein
MNRRHRILLAAGLLLLAAGGCNKSGLFQASGRLTHKGQPIPSTFVIFHPKEEGKRASQGLTDDNGHFTLTNSRSASGVLPGQHIVTLRYNVTSDEETHKVPPKASKELKAVIAKYGDPSTSTLKADVTKDGQVIDIEIPD